MKQLKELGLLYNRAIYGATSGLLRGYTWGHYINALNNVFNNTLIMPRVNMETGSSHVTLSIFFDFIFSIKNKNKKQIHSGFVAGAGIVCLALGESIPLELF
jgi:hypothetical protein